MSDRPFYDVRGWSFLTQLVALTVVLVALGIVVGRAVPDPLVDDFEVEAVSVPAPTDGMEVSALNPAIEGQVEELKSEEPIDNDELIFTGFRRIGPVETLAEEGKAELVADFEGPHGSDEVTFELWEHSQVAALRLQQYEADSRPHAFLHPPVGSWASFCRDSSGDGIQCFARVENAVIHSLIDGNVVGDPNVKKIDAGILVNIGVKHWVRTFGDTDDVSR